ncbi:hypothetical protein JTM55_34755, partial [Pseudomonas aeruginosa]|nr:hypothetical protein [Pseudomonas aeruginosa]
FFFILDIGWFLRRINISRTVRIKLLRNRADMCLSEGRLRVVLAKLNKPKFYLALHFIGR